MKRTSKKSPRRRRLVLAIVGLGLLMPAGGCRMCADCNDMDYPAFGGAWERTRRDAGRVGSVFDPAGAKASSLVTRETPNRPDEMARERQADGGDPSLFEETETVPVPKESEQEDMRKKIEDLRNRKLEDIETENEEQMRSRTLDDLNVQVEPGSPGPPIL